MPFFCFSFLVERPPVDLSTSLLACAFFFSPKTMRFPEVPGRLANHPGEGESTNNQAKVPGEMQFFVFLLTHRSKNRNGLLFRKAPKTSISLRKIGKSDLI